MKIKLKSQASLEYILLLVVLFLAFVAATRLPVTSARQDEGGPLYAGFKNYLEDLGSEMDCIMNGEGKLAYVLHCWWARR